MSKRNVPPPPQSPKEDGEIGETVGDILDRHPAMSPGMRRCINEISRHGDVLSPEVGGTIARLLSAALSPLEQKLDQKDAKDALHSISSEMLPKRHITFKKMQERHTEELRRLSQEAAKAVQAEHEARREAVAKRRNDAVVVAPPKRRKRDNLGRASVS